MITKEKLFYIIRVTPNPNVTQERAEELFNEACCTPPQQEYWKVRSEAIKAAYYKERYVPVEDNESSTA